MSAETTTQFAVGQKVKFPLKLGPLGRKRTVVGTILRLELPHFVKLEFRRPQCPLSNCMREMWVDIRTVSPFKPRVPR